MSIARYGLNSQGVFVNMTDGGFVSYQDYAKLAAENAGLKEWSPNPCSASMFEAIEKVEKLMDDGMPELAMVEAFEILKMQRTPDTDAFLAEVRAQGVEMFAAYCGEENSVFVETKAYYRSLPDAAYEFAAQLRQEAAQ